MNHAHHRALLVSNREEWRARLTVTLLAAGLDVYVVMSGLEANDLIGKKAFDLIILDDSLEDLDAPELCLGIKERLTNGARIIVSGDRVERFVPVWKRCGVTFAGSPPEVEGHVAQFVMARAH